MLHDQTHINLIGDFGLKMLLEDSFFQVDRIEYPYFETIHFTKENLLRLFDTSKVSPPFYGNLMSFYAVKIGGGKTTAQQAMSQLLHQKQSHEREIIQKDISKLAKLGREFASSLENGKNILCFAPDSYLEILKGLMASLGISNWQFVSVDKPISESLKNTDFQFVLAVGEFPSVFQKIFDRKILESKVYLVANKEVIAHSIKHLPMDNTIEIPSTDCSVELVVWLLSNVVRACQVRKKFYKARK